LPRIGSAIISQHHEHRVSLITSNRILEHWAEIFNNKATLASALPDRLLHTEPALKEIKRQSHRMNDCIDH